MEIHLPYGQSFLTANIPDGIGEDIIEPPKVPAAFNPVGIVRAALEVLLGNLDWDSFAGVKSVAIAINDKTRPVPHRQLLLPLLKHLSLLGIPDTAITFYIAGGSHPVMTSNEFPLILPKRVLQHYRVISHDSKNDNLLIYLGETSRGTPIWSNKAYVQSDLKIVVGNIEPHQFVGFSGGVKSAAIGLAGLTTINRNHALMVHPDSQLGEYETNPARQDVEEIGQKIGVHLALNAILNQKKQIVHVLAGAPRIVMEVGVPLSRQVCQVKVKSRYALLLVSPGGHPKDINLYQAQKGLAQASRIALPKATIILAAACPEGTGSSAYEAWMEGMVSFDHVFRRFKQEGFSIGPHKAYQIARDASRVRLLFFSEMDLEKARSLLLSPVKSFQQAIDSAVVDLPMGSRIGIMPYASLTIPYIE